MKVLKYCGSAWCSTNNRISIIGATNIHLSLDYSKQFAIYIPYKYTFCWFCPIKHVDMMQKSAKSLKIQENNCLTLQRKPKDWQLCIYWHLERHLVGTLIKQVPHTCKIRQIRAISVRKKHSRILSWTRISRIKRII